MALYPASNDEASANDQTNTTVAMQYFETGMTFIKRGHLVEVIPPSVIKANSNMPQGTITHTASGVLVPEAYRPASSSVTLYPQQVGNAKVTIIINPNGTITGYNYGTAITARISNFCNEAMYFTV